MTDNERSAEIVRDPANEAAWLRTVAEGADVIPPHGDDISVTQSLANQWLWPETRDELFACADFIEYQATLIADLTQENARLTAQVEQALRECDESALAKKAEANEGTCGTEVDHWRFGAIHVAARVRNALLAAHDKGSA